MPGTLRLRSSSGERTRRWAEPGAGIWRKSRSVCRRAGRRAARTNSCSCAGRVGPGRTRPGEPGSSRCCAGGAGLPGLLEHLTLWGRGPMNINTLRPAVLAALVEDPNQIKAFVNAIARYRTIPTTGWTKAGMTAFFPPQRCQAAAGHAGTSAAAGSGCTRRQARGPEKTGWRGRVTNTYMSWQYRVVE